MRFAFVPKRFDLSFAIKSYKLARLEGREGWLNVGRRGYKVTELMGENVLPQ